MIVKRFVLRHSEIAGAPPTVRLFTPDLDLSSIGVKSVQLNVTDGKMPTVVVGLNVKQVDVDIPNAVVLLNAVPVSVEQAVHVYQGLANALLKLGVLEEDSGEQKAADKPSGLIVSGG